MPLPQSLVVLGDLQIEITSASEIVRKDLLMAQCCPLQDSSEQPNAAADPLLVKCFSSKLHQLFCGQVCSLLVDELGDDLRATATSFFFFLNLL